MVCQCLTCGQHAGFVASGTSAFALCWEVKHCCFKARPSVHGQVVEKPPFFMKPRDRRRVIHVNFFAASVRSCRCLEHQAPCPFDSFDPDSRSAFEPDFRLASTASVSLYIRIRRVLTVCWPKEVHGRLWTYASAKVTWTCGSSFTLSQSINESVRCLFICTLCAARPLLWAWPSPHRLSTTSQSLIGHPPCWEAVPRKRAR